MIALGLTACAEEQGKTNDAVVLEQASQSDVQGFVGTHTRIVWVQDVGDGKDFYGEGHQLRLMGFDSLDGRGERPILPEIGHYAKPVITPRGDRVLFSDRHTGKVFIVNWDGTELRELSQGRTLSTWMDWANDREWAYVGRNQGQKDREQGLIVRFPLDDPGQVEHVWDNVLVNENNFIVSADGTRASINTPHGIGIANLQTGEWEKFGEGCWTALAPDNSYLLWIFEGSHRRVSIFDPRTHQRRSVVVNGGPGIDGHRVFHPRWSNHPRFLAVTGPFREGVRGGGKDVEIYLGRFNVELTEVGDWLRITRNEHADFYPDVWIAPDEAVRAAAQSQRQEPEATTTKSIAWPGDARDLTLIWDNRAAKNEILEPATGKPRLFSVRARGLARFGRFQEMNPHGGFFEVEYAGQERSLFEQADSGAWALEALITPDASRPCQDGVVLAMAGPDHDHCLAVVQQEADLLFNSGPSCTAGQGETSVLLGRLRPGQPAHLVVSSDQGYVRTFLNGQEQSSALAESMVHPPSGSFIYFGDLPGRHWPWHGGIEAVAIYARALPAEEVRHKHALLEDRLAQREAAPWVEVEARLVQTSTTPTVKSIAPYRRALVVNEYEAQRVVAGDLPGIAQGTRFLAAHWAILDETPLPDAVRSVGQTVTLHLHAMDDRPELEGEWMSMDVDNVLLPLFYDLDT